MNLKKRTKLDYFWGRKQDDEFGKLTNFIYKTASFETLLERIEIGIKDNPKYNDLRITL